ncbi:MAG TPA: hypothetical protein VK894_00625 [Jiangellales bacterium]|nr:hypothetical protein [Jiangellales bacterium]
MAVPDATHRSFDSTYCEQLQASGAVALDLDALWDPRALLDRHTFTGIARSPASGFAEQYCPPDSFTTPVDVRPLVTSVTGFDFDAGEVPTTGLDTEEVEAGMAAIAVAFFGTALDTMGSDGLHLTRYLAPTWLQQHVPMVGCVEIVAGEGSISPPGQQGTGHCLE